MELFKYLSLIIVASLNLFLVIFMLKDSYKDRAGQYFSNFVLGIFFWSVTILGFLLSENELYSLIFMRLSYVSAIIIAISFFGFASNFPNKIKLRVNIKWQKLFALLFGIIAIFTGFIVKNIDYNNATHSVILNNFGWWVFAFYFIYYFLFSHYILFKSYLKLNGNLKKQVKLILISVFVFGEIFGVIFNLILPSPLFLDWNYIWLGPSFTFFIVLTVFYAVIKYHLMNLKIIIQKSVMYAILIMFISVSYGVLILLGNLINFGLTRNELVVLAGVTVVFISLTLPSIQSWFNKITDKIFFKDLINYSKAIKDLNYIFNTNTEMDRMIYKSIEKIKESFKLDVVSFLYCPVDKRNKCDYYISHSDKTFKKKVTNIHSIIDYFSKDNKGVKMLFYDDLQENPTLPSMSKVEVDLILKEFNILNSSLCISVENEELLGILCLGVKLNNEPFYVNDVEWFNVIGEQFGLAVERGALYDNLEKLVDKRTKQLKVSNEKLQKINEAKSEFVSVASHQLRTPLTVIKSIFSLGLGGDLGKLTKIQKEYYKKGFDQSQKLINLIQELLNISRIETGRMSLKLQKNDIISLLKEVIDDYKKVAKSKKIKLVLENNQKIPLFKFDHQLIYQVASNLIDNAVKYSDKGIVKIIVKKNNGHVRIIIEDQGIGVSEKDLAKLFDKFIRGSDSSVLSRTGTGLGLYFSKRVVEAHKGELSAHSKGLNKGSVFEFKLPIK